MQSTRCTENIVQTELNWLVVHSGGQIVVQTRLISIVSQPIEVVWLFWLLLFVLLFLLFLLLFLLLLLKLAPIFQIWSKAGHCYQQ